MATSAKPATTETEAEPITAADLKRMAAEYHVPMDDSTLEKVAATDNPNTEKAFEEFMKMTAAGLYPTLAKMIEKGFKTGHLLAPYAEVKKAMLGPDATFDPIGNHADEAALHGGHDPETGHPAPMSLSQWKQHIKGDPSFGWQHTPEAHAQSQDIINALHQGLTGGAEEPGNG